MTQLPRAEAQGFRLSPARGGGVGGDESGADVRGVGLGNENSQGPLPAPSICKFFIPLEIDAGIWVNSSVRGSYRQIPVNKRVRLPDGGTEGWLASGKEGRLMQSTTNHRA